MPNLIAVNLNVEKKFGKGIGNFRVSKGIPGCF